MGRSEDRLSAGVGAKQDPVSPSTADSEWVRVREGVRGRVREYQRKVVRRHVAVDEGERVRARDIEAAVGGRVADRDRTVDLAAARKAARGVKRDDTDDVERVRDRPGRANGNIAA